ncbi:MAG: 3-hydroxyacyl-ACP dehydratase [Epsilonproteobacteria bacterium]|nr:MAG: 3-hydroxyacyl-ACP dehydratase [Campylobacterota bacterium]
MINVLTDGLYEIIEQSKEKIELQLSDALHPVFKAHFENNPLLPGFLQLDLIAEVLNKEIETIVNTKFMKPILPEMHLTFVLSDTKRGQRILILDRQSNTVSDMRVHWKDR